MFERRTSGIFDLLDEECRLPNPRIECFMQKVIVNHGRCRVFSSCQPNKTASQQNNYSFVIRHFSYEVLYTVVKI